MQNDMRDRLIELVKTSPYGITSSIGETFYHSFCKTIADHLIENDVIIRDKARWKGLGLGDYYCSICNAEYSGGNKFKFCPNCGSDMR